MKKPSESIAAKEGFLFLAVVLLEVLLVVLLAAGRRMVIVHDAFQYFSLQYYFLNHATVHGEIPLWMPFMSQGTAATWWYAIQAGLGQNLLLCGGAFFKPINFLSLFYAGIFVETLLLLTGTWLLAKRFFSSRWTVLFVTAAVGGSTVWTSQPWFNFHFYYALPMILHLLHLFLEGRGWRYFFLAGNLLALQTLGNLPYFIAMISCVVFLYFLFYAVFNAAGFWKNLRSLSWNGHAWLALLATAASLGLAYAVLRIGVDSIVQYNIGRNPDNSLQLETFLTYGGNRWLLKWIELALRISPALDYTLYAGVLTCLAAVWGLLCLDRRRLHFLALAAALLAISTGTPLARLLYTFWPAMKFYRHLGLITCFIKWCLCFLAGAGFEALFFSGNVSRIGGRRERLRRLARVGIVFSSAALSCILFALASRPEILVELWAGIFLNEPWEIFPLSLTPALLKANLLKAAWLDLLVTFLLGALLVGGSIRNRKSLLGLTLLLHLVDLYGYRLSDALLKTVPLTHSQMDLTRFQAMPFPVRRVPLQINPNARALQLFPLPLYESTFWANWSVQSFLFTDEPGSLFRIDHWLLPLDQFMRAYWGQPIHDRSSKPAGLVYWRRLEFPLGHPAAAKMAGVTEDKIQFFSGAHGVRTEEEAASLMTDKAYAGDLLLIQQNEARAGDLDLAANDRLRLPYRVNRFDSNHLEFTVTVPGGKPAWAFYSDVWHPFWKAKVNGRPVPVARANLAYKAVPILPGENRVHFFFESKALVWAYRFFGINALIWVAGIVVLAGRIIGAGNPASREARN